MNRKEFDSLVNNDREIMDLRMQSEELINCAEVLTQEDFDAQANRIARDIDKRIVVLMESKG